MAAGSPWRSSAVLVAMFVNGVVNNPAYHWDTVGKYLFDQRLSRGRAASRSS